MTESDNTVPLIDNEAQQQIEEQEEQPNDKHVESSHEAKKKDL